jgi:hypothetical protein
MVNVHQIRHTDEFGPIVAVLTEIPSEVDCPASNTVDKWQRQNQLVTQYTSQSCTTRSGDEILIGAKRSLWA